jgi:hypothetical protein
LRVMPKTTHVLYPMTAHFLPYMQTLDCPEKSLGGSFIVAAMVTKKKVLYDLHQGINILQVVCGGGDVRPIFPDFEELRFNQKFGRKIKKRIGTEDNNCVSVAASLKFLV